MECPNCSNKDSSMIEEIGKNKYLCWVCSKVWTKKGDKND